MDNTISLKLLSIHLPHYYAHIYQVCGINPKLTQPLTESSATTKQSQPIHNRVYLEVLAIMGYNINYPTPLPYGRNKYC